MGFFPGPEFLGLICVIYIFGSYFWISVLVLFLELNFEPYFKAYILGLTYVNYILGLVTVIYILRLILKLHFESYF